MALIKCPDCGREVSDLAPACPQCGRPIAANPARGMGILASNVDSLPVAAPPKARPSVLVPVLLVALVLVVVGILAVLLFAPNPSGAPARAAPATTAPIAAPTPGAASAPTQRRAVAGNPPVNGITCDALESTVVHIHVHLAVFVDGEEIQIPYGVGVGQPMQVADTPAGPFVEDGTCFYWLHTHTEDGVVHIESPSRRTFTLGDFFDIWQQPLSPTQVGPAHGEVIVYLNGERVAINPHEIPLTQHALIQLDVGGDVPPYYFEFARGD
jgi:hypothetical protein